MQLTEAGIRTTGTNVSGYSLFRVSSLLQIDAGVAGRRRPHPLLGASARADRSRPDAGGLRATYPRSSEDLYNQEVPETSCSTSARTAPNSPWSNSTTLPAALHHRERRQARMARLQGRRRAARILPARRASRSRPRAALRHDLADDRSPRRKIACTLTTSAGKRRDRVRAPPPIDEEAEEQHRNRTTKKRQRWQLSRLRRDQQLRALLASLCRPCSASGWPARSPSARRAAARTSPPRPRRSRSGRSQAASASALGRIAGIRSWTLATTSFGVVVTIVQL